MGGRMLANGGLSQAAVQPHTSVPSWPVAAARHHRKQLAGRPTSSDRMRAAGKFGRPKQLSRSHEHAPHINGCKRHPGDAAAPSSYLTRLCVKTYAETYACTFGDRQLPTRKGGSQLPGAVVQLALRGNVVRSPRQLDSRIVDGRTGSHISYGRFTRFYDGLRRIVGRFARLTMIDRDYRREAAFGFSCGHSENPKAASRRTLGKAIINERSHQVASIQD